MSTMAAASQERAFISRRALMIGAGSAATAGVAALMTPRHYEPGVSQVHVNDLMPNAVGPWRAEPSGAFVLPADAGVSNAYDQIATRRFTSPTGPDIMFLIAHGAAQSGLMRVHRPEVCYAASGFQVRGLHSLALDVEANHNITAQTFVGVRDDRVENVLYWTRIGGFFPGNLMAQRLVMLRLGLLGQIPDGVLVRMSAIGDGQTSPTLMRFARELVGGSTPQERALLLGRQDSRSLT